MIIYKRQVIHKVEGSLVEPNMLYVGTQKVGII